MLGEAIAAVLVGMAGLLLVLQPLFRPSGQQSANRTSRWIRKRRREAWR